MPTYQPELDDDDKEAYDSLSNRPPNDDLSIAGRAQDTLDDGDDLSASPEVSPISHAVMNQIKQKNSAPQGSSADDPLMQDFDRRQVALQAQRAGEMRANAVTNIGQALSQAALGANTPVQNTELYKNIENQNKTISKGAEEDEDRRVKVLRAIASRDRYKEVTGTQSSKAQLQQERLDQSAHQRVITRLSNDKQLSQRVLQYQNLDTALSNFMNAETTTPQQVDELQQAIRSNLGIKGAGGVDERKHTYINTLGLDAARIQQLITGDPANISSDSKLIGHLKNLVKLEQGNIRNQIDSRLNAVSAGNASMYARRKDLKSDLLAAIEAQKGQFQATSEATPKDLSNQTTPVSDPLIKTIEHEGKQYTYEKGEDGKWHLKK